MPLTNTQYDEIMRKYNRIQSRRQRLLQEHQEEIQALLPRVTEINHEISDASMKKARELLTGSPSNWSLEDTIRTLAEERHTLLLAHGYPADYLELSYDCPRCQDTGYIGGKKCDCFKRAAIELLYAQSQLSDVLEKENFDTFEESFYPTELRDGSPLWIWPAAPSAPQKILWHILTNSLRTCIFTAIPAWARPSSPTA